MANGFLCTQCGWQETDHSGQVTEWTEADLAERRKIKPGYHFSLMGEGAKVCGQSYTPSKQELALYKKNPELAILPGRQGDMDESTTW